MRSCRNYLAALFIAIAGLMLQGCAAPTTAHVPHFQWGQPVEFKGMLFTFNSARTDSYFTNWLDKSTTATDAFVIVDVTIMNKTGAPLPHHLQPIFRLIDASGATYEPHLMNSIAINMQKPGRPTYGQSMNPNTNLRQEIVFEAPRKKYVLQVIIPNQARLGFAGSVTSSGPYFIYDISSQLQS